MDNERGNLPRPLHGIMFPINSKGLFTIPQTEQHIHSLWYTSCGALAVTRSSSMCPPAGIDLMTCSTTTDLCPVPT